MTTAAKRPSGRGWSRAFKRLRRGLWKCTGWLVIGSAVLVGFGRLLAPHVDLARPLVEQMLTERVGQPVRIRRLVASWPRFSPMFELEGLSIGRDTQPGLQIERSRLEIRLYNLIRPGRNSLELVAIGLELALRQDSSGRWTWQLDQGGRIAGDWQRGLAAGDVVVRDSRVRIIPRSLAQIDLEIPEARLRRSGSQLDVWLSARPVDLLIDRIEARLSLQQGADGLQAVRAYGYVPQLRSGWPRTSAAAAADDARLQAWFDWNRVAGARLHARGRLDSRRSTEPVELQDELSIDGAWQQDWLALEINAAPRHGQEQGPIEQLVLSLDHGRLGIDARFIELAYLHALATPWFGERFEAWPSQVEGTLRQFGLAGSAESGLFRFEGQAEGFGVVDPASGVELHGLDLVFDLAGDRAAFELAGAVDVTVPAVYGFPVSLERIGGRLELLPGGARLQALQLAHSEFELQVDGDLLLAEHGPFIDLNVVISRLSPRDPRHWLPKSGLGPNTRRWLEQALVGLDQARAETVLYGQPLSWRKRVPHGALESHVTFRGLTLDYAPDWPPARQTRGALVFLGESLWARVDRSEIAGQALHAPSVRIRHLRAAEIELELESLDADAAGLATLSASFPLDAARLALEQMQWSGAGSATARLWLPVRHLRDWRLIGTVALEGARLGLPAPDIVVEAIHARIPFTRERFGPAVISAELGGALTEARLDAWLMPQFELSLDGNFAPQGLIPGSWRQRVPELNTAIQGRSELSIRLGHNSDSYGDGLRLDVASQLQGVSVDLPAPLQKSATQRWPLRLTLPLGDESRPAQFELEPLGSGLVLGNGPALQFGLALGDATARLPVAENFIVDGRVDQLDLAAWVALLARAFAAPVNGAAERDVRGDPGGDSSDFSGWLQLRVDELRLGDSRLGSADLRLERELNYWRFHAHGERMDGSVRLPTSLAGEQNLVADFERLDWPGVSAEVDELPAAASSIDPTRIPALNLSIRQMRWGDLDLGLVRVSSHRSAEGLEIEGLSAIAPALELSGSGRWVRAAAAEALPQTWINLRLNSDNLGQHLRQAGFDLALERGVAALEFAGRWPGSPVDFALRRVSGMLGVRIHDGTIPSASPGAGRVLGLVSLNSIPRRLRLDFSDVFSDGLGFDRINGDFVLTDGMAQTDNLKIEAPSAEIRISGLTDLGAQIYDQQVAVRPGLSATLPVIGALAGGPIGAAAGAALQQIFSGPLKGMSEIRYSVTGSWDEPQIEPMRDNSQDDRN